MTMKKILPILFLTVLCLFAATGCFDEPEPETYVIYFDTDGGLDIPSITTDGKSLVELPVPTKAGYEFLYWYITNEYGDTEFREDYLIYSPIESDITIHANWIEKARRVILHSNNGLDQQHFVSGVRGNDTFWFPENFFTKPGYYFSGWNTDPDGSGDFYEDDDSYIMPMGDDDVHFYAVWEPRRTSLELVLYGGSTPYLMIIATYDEVLPSEEIPTKIGYVFKGFYSEENGQGIRYYDEDMESDYIWDELEGIVTIYAYWEEKANNLVLNSNNGENNKALIENIKGGFNVELPVCGFENPGYVFGGWCRDPQGVSTIYQEGSTFTMPIADTDMNLYAIWLPNNYKVEFYANDGTSNSEDQYFLFGQEKALKATFFTKVGYQLSGWSTTPGGEKVYDAEESVKNLTTEQDGIVELYAVWAPNVYQVQFNANNGTAEKDVQIFLYDSTEALKKNSFTRTGYLFAGWSLTESGSKLYDDEELILNLTAEADAVFMLYAVWTPVKVNVTLDLQSGVSESESLIATYDEVLPELIKPSRMGYIFKGFYSEEDGKGIQYYDEEMNTAYVWQSVEDAVFYAHWEVKANNLVFKINNGESTTSLIENIKGGSTITLPANTFVNTGYTFANWNTKADASGDAYAVGVEFTMPISDTDIELYAVWTANTYKVQFNANNGTAEKDVQLFLYDSTEALKKNSFTRTGYLFAGWSLTESGSKLYDDEELILNLTAEADAVFMLYAVWTPVKVNVTLDLQSGVSESESLIATYDEVLPELIKPSRMGYIFKGFYSEEDGKGIQYYDEEMNTAYVWQSVEDTVFYAHWEVKANNLVFKINNGESTTSLIENIKGGSTITLPANTFVNTGYTFANWNTKADASGDAYAVGAEFTMPISDTDIELYAVWTANTYQVTLNKSEGTGGSNSAEAIFGEKLPAGGEKPSRNGYRFLGYYAGENGSGKLYYDENMVGVQNWDIAQDTVLYAGWEAIDYQITYNLNQGLNSQNNPLVYNIVEGVPTFYQPTRVGYNFGGWYPNMYFSGAAVTSIPIGSYGDVTLYAKWTPITYRIKFQPNGGEGTMSDQLLNYDQSRSLSKNSFTRYGYVFLGWSTNPFTNYQYVDEATVINLSNVDQSEIILYAIWNPVSVYIMFDADIGVIEGYSGRHYTYGKYIDYLPICKSPHYIFAGWYSTGIEAEVTLNTIVNNINMNMYSYQVTLHPRWIEKDEWSGYTRIYDKAGFESIRNNVYGNYVIMNDINYGGDTIAPFPIFYGNIYGLGHKIYNYTINTYVNEGSINRVGLFGGLAADASIKYLGVQGNIILGQGAYTSNETIWIGGLAAISNGLIYGCYNAGTIDVTASIAVTFDYFIVGGLVGELYLGKVQNSYNSGSVTAYNRGGSGIGSGRTFVGGIIGLIYEGEISGCYNTGDIKGTSNSPSSNDLVYVGGILGYGTSNQNVLKIIIRNCYNKGTITVTSTSQACLVAGGIAGELGGASTVAKLVENCYTVGKIVKDKASKWDNYIFGFISKSSNYTKNNNYCYLDPAGSATESGNSNITVLTNYNDFMTLATILNNGGSTWKNINYNTTILSWQQEAYFLS